MVTKYNEICVFCGKPKNCSHHLISGKGLRKLADEDSLIIPCCDLHHNLASKPEDKIHENPRAEDLSKMLGQVCWEKHYIALKCEIPFDDLEEEAREKFRERYGISFL